MKLACCAWCNCFVRMGDDFDPKDKARDVICSPECQQNEYNFRVYFSDANIMKWRENAQTKKT